MKVCTQRNNPINSLSVIASPGDAYIPAGQVEVNPEVIKERTFYTQLGKLSELAAAGDQRAFRLWLEGSIALVYRLVLHIVGAEQQAQDIVQETYIRAWQGLSKLRDHQASVSWVCRVARNIAMDYVTKRKKLQAANLLHYEVEGAFPLARQLASEDKNPEEIMAAVETRSFVRAAIEALPLKHRMVLLLKEIEGLSDKEIATALGCPPGTVESRLHRARLALAKKIRRLAKHR